LLLLGIHRGNQVIMFLGNFETLHEFELFIITLAIPLSGSSPGAPGLRCKGRPGFPRQYSGSP
jgi:hypothetical protein